MSLVTSLLPRVVILSMWANDVERGLEARVNHLLAKTYANLRYVWVVGDSQDDTENLLHQYRIAHMDKAIAIVRYDSNIADDNPNPRLMRVSLAANAGLKTVKMNDVYWLIHESDLITPVDVAERLMAHGKDVIGGWVTLGDTDTFYDSYVYRKDGVRFNNHAPFHACYKPNEVFELDSIGSCWLFPAKAIRDGMHCDTHGALQLCEWLKAHHYSIWCDPTTRVIQPVELWSSRQHASY